MSPGGADKKVLVELVELLLRLFLVVEHLDHSLPGHAFFHKSGHIRQIQLLPDEIFPAISRYKSGHNRHHKNHKHRQQGQDRA